MKTPRRRSVVAVALVAGLGLTACTAHDPSAKRVARELIESLAVDTDVRECMLDKLDTYPRDDLERIGDALTGDNVAARDEAAVELAAFEADLAECTP